MVALAALAMPAARAQAAPAGFVQAAGAGLVVDGTPWRAIGVNLWDLDPGKVLQQDITGCAYQHADLDAYFDGSFRQIAQNTHATVVRTFGFRSFYTAGGADWSSTDKLLYYAQKWNLRVIPVLGDQYETCGSPAKDAAWYRSGYRAVEEPWGIDYRSYVVRAVARYKDSPVIAFWQLMNEATAGSDTGALEAFSRAMVTAIRDEAGDTHHLVNLGTAADGTQGVGAASWARLLDCAPSSGGCNDLAEAHAFSAPDALPGRPMSSDATMAIRAWNTAGDSVTGSSSVALIDGWSVVRATLSLPPSNVPYTSWAVRVDAPAGGAFTVSLDDGLVQTSSGAQLFTFETGTDGFSGPGVARSTQVARSGLASLKADVASSTTTRSVTVTAPPITGTANSIEIYARVSFRAPRTPAGASLAADHHAAVVARGRPFLLGEAGWRAAVPGVSRCSTYDGTAVRAQSLSAMLALQSDPVYGGSGVIVWDWKDPALRSTRADGTQVTDPTVDCWTVTPGDPAEAVLRTYADAAPAIPALPAPAPLPVFDPRMTVLSGPSGVVGRWSDVRIQVRLTRGGDAMPGVRMTAGDGCMGAGVTDGLGLATVTCMVTALGPATITVKPDAAQCACDLPPASFPIVAKRTVALSGEATVVERGTPSALTLVIEDPSGAAVAGLTWRVPACGVSGIVGGPGSRAEIHTTCPTDGAAWRGTTALRLSVDETTDTTGADVAFVGLGFDRLYRDPRTGECVGLSPSTGWAGATARARGCGGSDGGAYADWFAYQVPVNERGDAFRAVGGFTTVSVDAKAGRRIDGIFETDGGGRSFVASVVRPAGVVLLAGV